MDRKKNIIFLGCLFLLVAFVSFAPQIEIRKAASGSGPGGSGNTNVFDSSQFSTSGVNGTNVAIKSGALLTNPVVSGTLTLNGANVLTTASLNVTNNVNIETNLVVWLTTTDNTTNTIYSFTPTDNAVVRVWADIVGFNSVSSAGYGKVATFKSTNSVVVQVGITATVGSTEEDSAYEALIDTAANAVRVRVAGNTGKTVNWIAYVKLFYAP